MQRRSFLGGLGGVAAAAVTSVGTAAAANPTPSSPSSGTPQPTEPESKHRPSGRISVKEFGARGDGTADDSAAFDNALAHIVEYGGALYVPAGRYKITRPLIALNLYDKIGGLRISGDGPSSQIRPTLTGPSRVFQVGNAAESTVFEDLAFVGDGVMANADCGAIVHSAYGAGPLVFNRVAFAGLRSDSPNFLGLINADFQDVVLRDCHFGGCGSIYGAMVNVERFRTVLIETCSFIDYMDFDGQANRKTGDASAYAWILIQNPIASPAQSAAEQGSIIIRRCRFDEGSRASVRIDPGIERIQRVIIEDCDSNVSGADVSYGVTARNVDRLTIRRSRFSWAAGQVRDAVDLHAVQVAELEHVYAVNGASRISADAETEYLHLRDCVYGTLASSARVTHLERMGLSERIEKS